MQNQGPIADQIQAAFTVVDGAVELKLIDAWVLTGEKAGLGVIAVLSVVDDIMEGNGATRIGVVVTKAHRESYMLCCA